jgi:hypothetical protein
MIYARKKLTGKYGSVKIEGIDFGKIYTGFE